MVGVIDSGYWPESASFAGAAARHRLRARPSAEPYRPYKSAAPIRMNKSDGGTFTGSLPARGEAPPTTSPGTECNTKVISARYFAETYKAQTPVGRAHRLPRPRVTATVTAAMSARPPPATPASRPGSNGRSLRQDLRRRPGGQDGGLQGLLQQRDPSGLDLLHSATRWTPSTQAIPDGVDVINFSISGSDDLADPVDLAFLSAAAAGIFVSASAGNSGPGPSTLDHVAPWLTTVAASTVAPYAGTVVLGNGNEVRRHQHHGAEERRSRSAGHRRPGQDAPASRRPGVALLAGTLDPAKAAGKIVVCDRGVIARVGEVRRGQAGRRHRHGAGQPDRQLARRRPPRRADGAPQRAHAR